MYPRLYKELKDQHVRFMDLADLLHLSSPAISYRFSGKTEWKLDECYAVLKFLGISFDRFHEFFPPRRMIA